MTIEEARALNILKSSNFEAWNIFTGYINRRFEYEKDKLVSTTPEFTPVQQGIAKAYGEMSIIEDHAEEVYNAHNSE
jgi:hypothetical protein